MARSFQIVSYYLEDVDDTLNLGEFLAETFMRLDRYPALLFTGALGAGKTTMIRGIVQTLPGGGDAQVSSPSFNILNIYPTRPEAAHFDLYRVEGLGLDPESEDVLTGEDRLIFVEWSDFLPEDLLPADCVHVSIFLHGTGRKVDILADMKFTVEIMKTVKGRIVFC